MTLQRRVLGYLALAAIASCALTVVVGAVLVRRQISSQQLTALASAADALATVGGAAGALAPGQHVYSVESRQTEADRTDPCRNRACVDPGRRFSGPPDRRPASG